VQVHRKVMKAEHGSKFLESSSKPEASIV